ncbi:MAG: acyl-CoA dehydratase activase [Eubacteriales bacterium]|jgi:predicted CoA-substrate-specific enzyme activase
MTQQITTGVSALNIGIDVGSTTAKIVVTDNGKILHEKYERHFSQVREKILELFENAYPFIGSRPFHCALSGSAGLGIANAAGIPFVQEVFATAETVKLYEPDTDVVIELGGEDAKIIFFAGGLDERMNGSCAGGTGAFIDQMASLLNVTPDELDALSLKSERIYPIASRCGVFAKTDIQPLLNQGARKEDIAASIYQAVVNQTIAGLAQGRKITGKVMFLGGPLSFCMGLRRRFTETLKLDDKHAVFPDYARFSVSYGAALYASHQKTAYTFDEFCKLLKATHSTGKVSTEPPLFADNDELDAFLARHTRADVKRTDIASYTGKAYLGIDCGSTTTKLTLTDENDRLLYSYYDSNKGNPVEIVREQLTKIYELCGNRIQIASSAVTGYGEELIKHAFGVDIGIVETLAHLKAAKFFNPKVDFILDIGGQDIKCFKVRNGAIDSIMLNEACSSGCGSFIETFAKSMGYDVAEFSKLGLLAKHPVSLGTRCTVFMNSSVKQAQKDGAGVCDISAGLSLSVVRNAIYKVIRASSAAELGENIVVQGGTFLNNAVLRSFEREIGHNVIRPEISGLMGAFGASLYAKALEKKEGSTLISPEALKSFTHKTTNAVCHGCTNNCRLTVNIFPGGVKYISGNKCEKGAGLDEKADETPNLHEFKRTLIEKIAADTSPAPEKKNRGTLGLPLALGMYELLPLWHGIFKELGFTVKVSPLSGRDTYFKGQQSIPSDTACYPAKLMHGHVETLIEEGVDAIFYPCISYNVDENVSDNHYNCPVVAYYSELLHGNVEDLSKVRFLYPYLNITDRAELVKELHRHLNSFGYDVKKHEVKAAVAHGFAAYEAYMSAVRAEGERAVTYARDHGKRILILAGRPYHTDPEIGHGIDKLCRSLGFAVVSEDSVWHMAKKRPKVGVLNQWTYHSRLYNAAEFAVENNDAELVQLVSFGCGLDAITTDEVKDILERDGKLYTQIKIDEITNLGAVKIRLRSLIGAIEERSAGK